MRRKAADEAQVTELILQAVETERGGIEIYTAAIKAATNDDLRKEWKKYLDETRKHEQILTQVCKQLGLDPNQESPGRDVVAHQGASLVKAIEMAIANGEPDAAQLVAAECVVLAETKDHLNWELIGEVVKQGTRELADVLKPAYEEVEKEEDHHLYHTKGWCRELWIESLGFPAVLPPPEEVKKVETAIGASRAEQARTEML
jgi:rubrerythrin